MMPLDVPASHCAWRGDKLRGLDLSYKRPSCIAKNNRL